jgi:molybdate transport system regulatory protein
MKIRHRIWLEEHGEAVYGPGRNKLFRMIEEGQSLNAVAKKLKISYHWVWSKIKDSEERLGINLVEVDYRKRGMHLTKEAKMLSKIFNDTETEVLPILKKAEKKFYSWKRRNAPKQKY